MGFLAVAAGMFLLHALLAIFFFIRWLKTKAGKEAIGAIEEIISAAVNDINATTVKALRAATEDGTLSETDAEHVKSEAEARIRLMVPIAVSKAASTIVTNLAAYISGKIEEKVSLLKE